MNDPRTPPRAGAVGPIAGDLSAELTGNEPALAVRAEALLAALRSADRYLGRLCERFWLNGMLKHKLLDHFRKAGGDLLAMNRDENLTRVAGLAPARLAVWSRTIVHPREPNGGAWISLNDLVVGVALVNGYAISAQAPPPNDFRLILLSPQGGS